MKLQRLLAVQILIVISLALVVIAVGIRPDTVGSDTAGYRRWYELLLEKGNVPEVLDIAFDAIAWCLAALNLPSQIFFISIASILSASSVATARNLVSSSIRSGGGEQSLAFSWSLTLLSPFYIAAYTNVIRQGVSSAVFFLACTLLFSGRAYLAALALGFSIGLHSSSALFIVVLPLLALEERLVRLIVLSSLVTHSLGTNEWSISALSDLFGTNTYKLLKNYGAEDGYRSGVRLDFVAYSVSIGAILEWLALRANDDILKKYAVKLYWIMLIPFSIFGFIAYSDRLLLPPFMYSAIVLGCLLGCRNIKLSYGILFLIVALSCTFILTNTAGLYM